MAAPDFLGKGGWYFGLKGTGDTVQAVLGVLNKLLNTSYCMYLGTFLSLAGLRFAGYVIYEIIGLNTKLI